MATRTTKVPPTPIKKGPEAVTFAPPVPIDPTTIPDPLPKGGRASNEPAIKAWLSQLVAGSIYELVSGDPDGGHPVNRVTQIRKVAGDAYQVTTRPIESGKRYRVFVSVADAATA